MCDPEMSKSIVKGIGIGFLSCIGIGIDKKIFQVLLRSGLGAKSTHCWFRDDDVLAFEPKG